MQEYGYGDREGLMCELFDNNVRKLYYYELVGPAVGNFF